MTHKNFRSLDTLGNAIGYLQTGIAKISGLLLMLGLVTASANLLMKDALFGHLPWLQDAWAIDQALAVDANVVLVFSMLFSAVATRDWVKVTVYSIIGGMLLFVSAIIMDMESVRQALNITLEQAAIQVHVSVGFLTQLRSWVVVLLVAMSGMDGINVLTSAVTPAPAQEETPKPVEAPVSSGSPAPRKTRKPKTNGEAQRYQEYRDFMLTHPGTSAPKAAAALHISESTVNRYRKKEKAVGNGFPGNDTALQPEISDTAGVAELLGESRLQTV